MIRQMTIEDIGAVIGLCNFMYQESSYQQLVFSASRCKEVSLNAIESGFAMVAVDQMGQIVGVMAGCTVQPAFSRDLMACDYLLYVMPGYRGTVSHRLVTAYVEWAKSVRARVITVGVTAGCDNANAIAFYESLGFNQCGAQLRMEV